MPKALVISLQFNPSSAFPEFTFLKIQDIVPRHFRPLPANLVVSRCSCDLTIINFNSNERRHDLRTSENEQKEPKRGG